MTDGLERKKRRVAVIVFGEVLSYDEGDAESGLMLAVRQALPHELEGMGASGPFPAWVREVRGLGMAVGDGHVQVRITNKAWRYDDLEPGHE